MVLIIILYIPTDRRTCDKCNSNELGDEFHYIFTCNFFCDERRKRLKKYYRVNPSTLKMHSLFNVTGKELYNLCRFIFHIRKHFK